MYNAIKWMFFYKLIKSSKIEWEPGKLTVTWEAWEETHSELALTSSIAARYLFVLPSGD